MPLVRASTTFLRLSRHTCPSPPNIPSPPAVSYGSPPPLLFRADRGGFRVFRRSTIAFGKTSIANHNRFPRIPNATLQEKYPPVIEAAYSLRRHQPAPSHSNNSNQAVQLSPRNATGIIGTPARYELIGFGQSSGAVRPSADKSRQMLPVERSNPHHSRLLCSAPYHTGPVSCHPGSKIPELLSKLRSGTIFPFLLPGASGFPYASRHLTIKSHAANLPGAHPHVEIRVDPRAGKHRAGHGNISSRRDCLRSPSRAEISVSAILIKTVRVQCHVVRPYMLFLNPCAGNPRPHCDRCRRPA